MTETRSVVAAAISNDTAALESFKTQGISLAAVTPSVVVVGPVVEAVKEGKVEEAKAMWSALSELGADIDCVDEKGRTAVLTAAMSGEVEVVRGLRALGANGDIDGVDEKGRTAVCIAALKGKVAVVRGLHALGAKGDIDKADEMGRTAVWMAAMNRQVELVRQLRELGAKGEIPPSKIVLAGHTGLRANLMGAYELQKERVAEFPLYKKADEEHYIYRDYRGGWAVAEGRKKVDGGEGWLCTQDSVLLPSSKGTTWHLHDGKGWVNGEGITARAQEGGSIVLKEEIDPNYKPTEDEVLEYAKWLGMDHKEDQDLFWIAKEGLKAPLPENWKLCKTKDTDEIYYFNFKSGESKWEHPCDEHYRNLYKTNKKKKGIGKKPPLSPPLGHQNGLLEGTLSPDPMTLHISPDPMATKKSPTKPTSPQKSHLKKDGEEADEAVELSEGSETEEEVETEEEEEEPQPQKEEQGGDDAESLGSADLPEG